MTYTDSYSLIGHIGSLPSRRPVPHPWSPRLRSPARGRHRLSRCGQRPVPRPPERRNPSGRRRLHLAGPLHRGLPHGPASLCRYHAGRRQAQVDLPRPRRHRPGILRNRNDWYAHRSPDTVHH